MPASWEHYDQDARTFAAWGVDFVKVDDCGGLPAGTSPETLTEYFREFGACLRRHNPDVVYSQELPIHQIGRPSFLRPSGLLRNSRTCGGSPTMRAR